MNIRNAAPPGALDDALALQVQISKALAEHPATCDAIIEVINDRNVITLEGDVSDAETRRVAEQIAANQPGVISVTNSLTIGSGQKRGS